MRTDGTLWLNIADSYCGTGSKRTAILHLIGRAGQSVSLSRAVKGINPRDMIGIPWMLAFSRAAKAGIYAMTLSWAKGKPMPESTKDRCTRSHEQFSCSARAGGGFYDWLAIAEPIAPTTAQRRKAGAAWVSTRPQVPGQPQTQNINKRRGSITDDMISPVRSEARRVVYQHRAV